MELLELTEGEPDRTLDLDAAIAGALGATGLAEVTQMPGSRTWQVRAGSKVGVARVGGIQVIVRPKVPIDRLIFMMRYAQKPSFWKNTPVLLEQDSDLADMLADSFAHLGLKALEQGLLNGYVEQADALPVLRGRLRVGDQISRHQRLSLPLEVSYQEFSVDIAENQLLLTAVLRLLRMPSVKPTTRRALQRLRLQLAGVTPVTPGRQLPAWHPSRLNVRYQPALGLAELILAGDSFEQRYGNLHVSGFTFDMWKIFEDFVCVALAEALRPYGGRPSMQQQLHLDYGKKVPMKPDFIWFPSDSSPLVVDAKYKAEKPSGFPNADLYQLLAYCTVLGISEGHLVYAKGNEDTAIHEVVGAGVRIHCHTLDLELPPAALLAQVAGLAGGLHAAPSVTESRQSALPSTKDRFSPRSISDHFGH